MNKQLEEDLKKTMEIISASWNMQNNSYDRASNFIYQMKSLNECLSEIERRNVNREYALHRWYNYMTSIQCEYIFCEYGAVHDTNEYNHDVDIFPFDVKLTVYPAKLSSRPYENMVMKSNFDLMRRRIADFMQNVKSNGLNEIVITDCGRDYKLMSDIIYLN